MALPTIANMAKVVVRGHVGSHLMENVLHHVFTGTLDQTVAQDMADTVGGYYNTLPDAMNASCGFDRIEVHDLGTVGGASFDLLPDTFPLIGTLTVGALPPNVCGLVSIRGASGGRSGRGRIYLGGFDEDASDGDRPDTDALDLMADFAGNIISDGGFRIVSYYHGTDDTIPGKRPVPIPRVTPVSTAPVSFKVRTTWASQRRRAN